jgi:hypothetical protein
VAGTAGPIGVTGLEAPDAGPIPTPLVAVTVNVYTVQGVRPVTRQDSGPLVQLQVRPSGELVAV